MAVLEIAIASKVLSQPILDLYSLGKERFSNELLKWKNTTSHSQLARKISKLQKVKTFWQRDKEISIYSFFYPSPILFAEKVKKEIPGLAHFPQTGNFVIQGTVGQGKSVFLRHLCAQELGENGSGRIPVFIELRLVQEQGLEVVIFDALDRLGFSINDDLFEFYAESGKLVLLLDGFDEIEEKSISTTILSLERLAEKYEKLQIIITSRPASPIQNSRHFRIVKLAPLTSLDHPKFLKKIGLSSAETTKILTAISQTSSAVSGLLTTPLMMTLLVVVYRAEQTIPSELPDFYERLFQTLFSKHDSIKPGLPKRHKSGLGEGKLRELFESFCFSVLQLRKKTTLSTGDFTKCFTQALKYSKLDCEEDCFKHDITRAVCLMQEEGFDVHFIHKSVLEFFAASFVRNLSNEAAQKFYAQLQGPRWHEWNQVIQFLSQIDRYRYSDFYAIPEITNGLKSLGIDPDKRSVVNIDDAMTQAFKGIRFAFRRVKDGEYRLNSMQGTITKNRFLDPADTPLFTNVFNDLMPNANNDWTNKFKERTDDEILVPWTEMLPSQGRSKLRQKFSDFIKTLFTNLDDALDVVRKEKELTKLIEI